MKYLKFTYLLISTFLAIGFINTVNAELPSGDEIAQKINARDEGIAVGRNLKMEMTDRHGKVRVRETRSFRKYFGEEKRTAIFYLKPKNIKDTAFLTYDYADKEKDDDQWLYLPAMRKVRRISASDRGDYFLGTDFSFEDIKLETRVSIKDYTRKTIGEDEVDGVHCYLVEDTSIDDETAEELGHIRRESCVDDNIWIVRKSIFWDLQNKLLKTIYFKDISKVQGIWTAHKIEVENHKTGHHTTFTFTEVDYNESVSDKIFTQNALKRGL
jgi:outer membrane lipoprotein-sorting protein